MQFISLVVFLIVTYFYISTIWSNSQGAPWVPTRMKTVRKMLQMAGLKPGETLYDLGAGDGRVLVTAARQFGARAVGIEIDPLRYLWACLLVRILRLDEQIRVIRGNLFQTALRDADVVFCYLLPRANDRLVEKLRSELRPKTRVICNTFPLPGWVAADADEDIRVYLYIV